MDSKILAQEIFIKMKELDSLVYSQQSLRDKKVYNKSCELDKLVVEFMKAVKPGPFTR